MHGLIRFVMPAYKDHVYLINGTLVQVDTSLALPIYYVEFRLAAYSEMDVILSFDSLVIEEDSVMTLIEEHFFDCPAPAFKNISLRGSNDWVCHDISGNKAMKINAYQSNDLCDDWLVFPVVNLENTRDEVLSFQNYTRYNDTFHPALKLKYSIDYNGSGNPNDFNWSALDFNASAANSGNWVSSGDVDISFISGDRVYFALHYLSSGTGAGTSTLWYVDDIEIRGKKKVLLYSQLEEEMSYKIYPNPVQSILKIVCPDQNKHKLLIYNTLGVIMLEQFISGTAIFNMQDLNPGMYYLKLEKQVQKVVRH